jgi:drug/metabolite transporter (DMT)-like permease
MDYPFYSIVLGKFVEPLPMVTAALIVTAIMSLIPLLWEPTERVATRDKWAFLGAALLVGVTRKLMMMYGLAHASPIDGSIINTVGPLLVLIISAAIGLDQLTKRKILGLLLGMGGAIAVVLTGATSRHEESQLVGSLLILGAACTSACYMVWFKGLISRYRITTVMRWIYCIAALVVLPFGADSLLHTDFSVMHGRILFAALFVIFLPTYLPNLMLNYALSKVSPTITSVYGYLQPVLAILLSVAMGLDKLHWDTILFASVIFIGVWFVLTSYNTPKRVPLADR